MYNRYMVEVQARQGDDWEPICYSEALSRAKGYVAAILRSKEIHAARVVDQSPNRLMTAHRSQTGCGRHARCFQMSFWKPGSSRWTGYARIFRMSNRRSHNGLPAARTFHLTATSRVTKTLVLPV